MEPYSRLAWTLLSALSIETKTMKLFTMVACNSFCNLSLTAKIVAKLDVISKGRSILGYGAGWKQDECEAFGFPFPKTSIRTKQIDRSHNKLCLLSNNY
jgi:alkanesulfonate monooxygenase SsuD/methylene tetrahydromethanopterin reductase-like flavin-dependent oxidoreductase (luciferase family)